MELIMWILIAIGIMAIYDARRITKKYFSKGDQNFTASIIKVFGFLVSALAGIAVLCI